LAWKIKWRYRARKQLEKLDKPIEKRIISYMENRVAHCPLSFGKALTGDMIGYWRYRVQDYRIICRVEDEELIVLVISVGHRKEIYD